jgi:nitrogen fixation/metabolism regulation signal transduction histidine kinase
VELLAQPLHGDPQQGVLLCVCDNGQGFQPQMLARVFDPYVTGKLKGTGLGLAIVKKIIEEHGGHIEVGNRPEGGASVRIVLPAGVRAIDSKTQRVKA